MLSPTSASPGPSTRRRTSGGGTIEHSALIGLLGALVTVTVLAVNGQLDAFLRDESCGFFRLLNPMDRCQSGHSDNADDRASLSLGRPTQQANATESLGDVLAGMDRRGDLFDPKREYQVAHNTHNTRIRDYQYGSPRQTDDGVGDRHGIDRRPVPSPDYERARAFALAQLAARNPVAAERYERIKVLEDVLRTNNKRLADYLPLSTAERPIPGWIIRSTARRGLSEKVVDDALPLFGDLGFDVEKVETRDGTFAVKIVGAMSHGECLASGLPDEFCEMSRVLEENARSPAPASIVIDPLLDDGSGKYRGHSVSADVEDMRVRLSVSTWREALVGYLSVLEHELAHHAARQFLARDPSFAYIGGLTAHVPPKLERQIQRCLERKARNCERWRDAYFEGSFGLDEIYAYKRDASTELADLQRLERELRQSGSSAPDLNLRDVYLVFGDNHARSGLILAEASVNAYTNVLRMLYGTPQLGDRSKPTHQLNAVYEESKVDGHWAGVLVSPGGTDETSPHATAKVPVKDKVRLQLSVPLRGVRDEEIFHEDVSAWNSAHSILLDYLGRQLEVFSDDVRELREMEEATNTLRANLKEQLKRLTSG